MEDGTRIKKKNRHIGSKQIRREELVHEVIFVERKLQYEKKRTHNTGRRDRKQTR